MLKTYFLLNVAFFPGHNSQSVLLIAWYALLCRSAQTDVQHTLQVFIWPGEEMWCGFIDTNLKLLVCTNTMYKIMCIFTYTYSQNTTICQILSLSNKQHYVIYNYMFRPCKRAIFRLFTELSSRLHNRSLGGGRRDLFLHNY